MSKAIAYYRVSTAKQGASGLGLDAQRGAVASYAASKGLTISAEFTEVETGTNKRARPEIQRAIAAAKAQNAILIIAKLDRLARSVNFISALMDSSVSFVACDMPEANELTINIMAAMAQHEAKLTSQRTKAALDAKLARDGEWRVSQLDDAARARGRRAQRQQSIEANAQAAFAAQMLRESGYSFGRIAEKLNQNGYSTPKGKEFKAMTVKRMLDRAFQAQEKTAV